MKKRFLVHRLHRAGDVPVPLLQRRVGRARGTEQVFQRRREQRAHRRRAVLPLVVDLLAVMAEIRGVERERSAYLCAMSS